MRVRKEVGERVREDVEGVREVMVEGMREWVRKEGDAVRRVSEGVRR